MKSDHPNLNVLLDGIEQRMFDAQYKEFGSREKFRHATQESANDVPSLVKALRESLAFLSALPEEAHLSLIKKTGVEPEDLPNKLQSLVDTGIRSIAAILQPDKKETEDLEERGGRA